LPEQLIYFDNAATTPVDEKVLESMLPFLKGDFGNPSSIHGKGRVARTAVENSRKTISKYLNTSPSEIFFTSCGTESNNLAIQRVVNDLGIKNVISSKIEHHCVLRNVEALEKLDEMQIHYVAIDEKGHFDLAHLDELLTEIDGQCFVTLMHANNEVGSMMNIKAAGEVCKKHKAIFHSDTVQTVGHFNIDLQDIYVHLISGSGHKFHGPKGSGFLYINNELQLSPMIKGGPQERNIRAGTENVSHIVGLGKAFEIAYENLAEESKYIQSLKNHMIEMLRGKVSGVGFIGDFDGDSLYSVLNVSFPPNKKDEMLLFNLDIGGICASSGSACGSGANVGSHVLTALKTDTSRKTIRFSFSKFNTIEEIDIVVTKLKELVEG